MIINIIVLLLFVNIALQEKHANLKIRDGLPDSNREFQFAVILEQQRKGGHFTLCSGSLIASSWVLTAAHCLNPQLYEIRYGVSKADPDDRSTLRKILKTFHLPNDPINYNFFVLLTKITRRTTKYFEIKHDIALLLIEEVTTVPFARLLATDYMSMIGRPGKFAGFGGDSTKRFPYPLQVGEGAVMKCREGHSNNLGPFICLAAKCDARHRTVGGGDSGGPLLVDGKVAGVCTGHDGDHGMVTGNALYTPVSPYLDWINNVIDNERRNK